jgi:alkylation response protein AidB-like acyl-CoA dehydrogenase
MMAPALLQHGNQEQREGFIAGDIFGDAVWCRGDSEPGSGSDLAWLPIRAELDGDEWMRNGSFGIRRPSLSQGACTGARIARP